MEAIGCLLLCLSYVETGHTRQGLRWAAPQSRPPGPANPPDCNPPAAARLLSIMKQRFLPPSWPMIVVIWALLLPLAPLAVQAGPLRPSGVPEGVQPGGDLATIEPKLNFDRVQPGQQV